MNYVIPTVPLGSPVPFQTTRSQLGSPYLTITETMSFYLDLARLNLCSQQSSNSGGISVIGTVSVAEFLAPNGNEGGTVQFYTSPDGQNWTAAGVAATFGTGSTSDGTMLNGGVIRILFTANAEYVKVVITLTGTAPALTLNDVSLFPPGKAASLGNWVGPISTTATFNYTAPADGWINSVSFTTPTAVTQSDTNYWAFALEDMASSNQLLSSGAANTTKATGGNAIAANTPLNLTLGSGYLVRAGDTLQFSVTATGSPTAMIGCKVAIGMALAN
jgi:hypothetical protein